MNLSSKETIHASGHYEPVFEAAFLPRCENCQAPHPSARKPLMPADKCPDCGTETKRGYAVKVTSSAITGGDVSLVVANTLIKIGNFIRNLSKGN